MMMKGSKHTRRCPICDGHQRDILFQQRFSVLSGGSVMNGYDVVICHYCGFCFADNLPDQTAFDIYYREMSKYEHQDRSGQPSEFETHQFPALAQFIQSRIPDPLSRILEIGCANGGLLNALKQIGYRSVLGVDPSPLCAQNAEQIYQIRVLTNSLSDLNMEIGPFDFIILVAVLEHIKDLAGALTKINDLLSPNGKLYIEVPDATQFMSSLDAPFQEFSIEHINFFSPESLTNLMGINGFSAEFSSQTAYEQTETHTGYAIRMIFQKNKGDEQYSLKPDQITRPSIIKYITSSHELENRIHKTVDKLVDNQRPLIVWGVGTHTQRLLATSRLISAKIVAYVDSNPNYHNKLLNGVPIINPDGLVGKSEPILVSSRIFQDEIVRQIRFELNLKNEIYTLYEG